MTGSRSLEQEHDGRPGFAARLRRRRQQGAVNPTGAVLALLLLLLSLLPSVPDAQARGVVGAAAPGLPALISSRPLALGAGGTRDLAASLAARGLMHGMTPSLRRACFVAFQRDLHLRASVRLPISCLSVMRDRASASATTHPGVTLRPLAQAGQIGPRTLPPPGIIGTVAGNGQCCYSGDGGPATQAGLTFPLGVALDGAGNLYITDTGNNRIRKVLASSGVISTVAGNGQQGYSGDGGPATQAELKEPQGVALDGAGNLYVGDGANNRVREVAASSGVISTVAGNGSFGYSGDGGPATQAELDEPGGVALDGAGNLYFADTYSDRVRVVGAIGSDGGPTPTPTPSPLALSIAQVNDSRHGPLYPAGFALNGDTTVDGNMLTVHVTINNPAPQSVAGTLTLSVAPSGTALSQSVTVPAATNAYPVALQLPTDGLAWDSSGHPVHTLSLVASFNGTSSAAVPIPIRPRPVVLVHGLNDTYQTWQSWDQPGGYLQVAGYPKSLFAQDGLGEHYGYPVDTMNTKTSPTYTTVQNAQELADYVEEVRWAEGADKVDLVAHSMGGLISRYYIANIMPGRVVTRLVMLGTPNAGSNSANVPTAIGTGTGCLIGGLPGCYAGGLAGFLSFPEPATYENTPEYVLNNTDKQTTARQGAHFFAVGGDIPITSLCASGDGYPSDLVVNHNSTRTVSVDAPSYAGLEQLSSPDEYQDMPVSHISLGCAAAKDGAETTSPQVFSTVFSHMLGNASMATSLGQSSLLAVAGPTLAAATPTASPVSVTATGSLTTPIMAAQAVSLTAGQSMSLTVQAANVSDLTALVAVNLGPSDTRPVLTLTSPSGAVSTAGAPQAGVGYADNSGGGPLPMLAFTTQNPQNGAWTLTVTNPATSTVNPLPFIATFTTDSATGLALSGGTDQPAYLPGQTASLTATLTQVNADGSTQPLGANTGATATAQLTSLLNSSFLPQTLTLYDDGQHGDGAANDGVYGITVTAPLTLGDYQVTVTAAGGGGQRVAQVPIQVQPLTPPVAAQIALSPPVAAPGASFGITSTACFSPNESVALTMSNALLGSVQADATGAISATERVPYGLNGEEPITATGQSSGVLATAPVAVILPPPALTLSRASGRYGNAVTITGTNFGATEPISLYLDMTGTAPLSYTTSITSSAFVATFSVPQAISGTHTLIALGANSGLTATTPFTVLPAAFLLHYQASGGARNVLYGTGFGPNELVKGYWNRQPLTVTATTSALGSVGLSGSGGITFTVPFSPTGTYAVYGVGQSSKVVGLTVFTIKPALYLKPASGKVGTTMQVVGTGYGAHETVTLRYDCGTPVCASTTVLGTLATNSNGIFATAVTIPVGTSLGGHRIGGKGGTSGVFATTTFTVTP